MTALDEAAAALAANDMARVEAIAGEILKTQPAHPMALHLLAAALSAQGRAAEALPPYQSAVEWLHGNLALTQVTKPKPERPTSPLRAACAAKAGLSAHGHS